jgi:dimeric dUTPase (all-alpha-NTP-PPase superfamily)
LRLLTKEDEPLDKLDKIFQLQKDLASFVSSERYPRTKEDRVSALCTAITHEAIELQRLTNWKWWKNKVDFDEDQAREELIDIWHFVVQTAIELDISPKSILDEYLKKNRINRRRHQEGY